MLAIFFAILLVTTMANKNENSSTDIIPGENDETTDSVMKQIKTPNVKKIQMFVSMYTMFHNMYAEGSVRHAGFNTELATKVCEEVGDTFDDFKTVLTDPEIKTNDLGAVLESYVKRYNLEEQLEQLKQEIESEERDQDEKWERE